MYMSRCGQLCEGSMMVNVVGLERGAKRTETEVDEVDFFYRNDFCPLRGSLAHQIS